MPDTASRIQDAIAAFVRDSPLNRFQAIDGSPMFDAPLIGVADGDDPLFTQYKTIIGPFHLTPREAIAHAVAEGAPGTAHDLAQLRVLCWALPIVRQTRHDNRRETRIPSRRWAHTRWYGEQFNDALRRHVVALLEDMGYTAIAPVSSPLFKSVSEGVERPPASNWSERHILYAAGLGTFSLNDGFITSRGMAMRCASVVTNAPLPVTARHYTSHLENCLYYRDGSCGKCIDRCPVGAIGPDGHDKTKCRDYSYGEIGALRDEYGVGVTGCGLCQTRVPCEERIPRTTR